MALTYLPNANKVELGGDRSATPLVVGVASLLVFALLGWGFYNWLSPDAAAPVEVSSGPVTIPNEKTPATPAVYGTEGEFFKVAFNDTPLAAADTGALAVTFPTSATVSGYAQTTTPLDVYENTEATPADASHVVITATLPKGAKYDPATVDAVMADLPKPLTEVTKFGYQGFAFTGAASALFKDDDKIKLTNPNSSVSGLFLVKGRTGYFVYAFDADPKTSKAFVDSFVPVASEDVTTPPIYAR